jgi:hypothetical protein
MSSFHKRLFFCFLLFAILLAGCAPGVMSYSPEQAAVRAITEPGDPNMVIDRGSVKVHQSAPLGGSTFVVVSFSGSDGKRVDKCTYVYETQQMGIGTWAPQGGGGGCTGIQPGEAEPPQETLQVGAGTGSNGPNDPGHSYVYGLVRPTENGELIVKVRVTWQDGQMQELNVINSSYLAVRAGDLLYQKIEGLNESGEVVHTVDAPPQMRP